LQVSDSPDKNQAQSRIFYAQKVWLPLLVFVNGLFCMKAIGIKQKMAKKAVCSFLP